MLQQAQFMFGAKVVDPQKEYGYPISTRPTAQNFAEEVNRHKSDGKEVYQVRGADYIGNAKDIKPGANQIYVTDDLSAIQLTPEQLKESYKGHPDVKILYWLKPASSRLGLHSSSDVDEAFMIAKGNVQFYK